LLPLLNDDPHKVIVLSVHYEARKMPADRDCPYVLYYMMEL